MPGSRQDRIYPLAGYTYFFGKEKMNNVLLFNNSSNTYKCS